MAFFGTPEIALPTLEGLMASRHEVACVVSQPDRGRGRGRQRSPSPVSALALDRDIPLLRSEQVGDSESLNFLETHRPDIGVVVAFGQFIPKRIRELPRLGYLINAHASLLPRHRGASPIQTAILSGDETTGISVMKVEREMDAGAVALTRAIQIDPKENTAELTARLGALAAEAILDTVEEIAQQKVSWTEQDVALATYAPRIEKNDGRLDWRMTTGVLTRKIRAFSPKPGAFTSLPATDKTEGDWLRILEAESVECPQQSSQPPGTLHLDDANRRTPLWIATGDGWLAPLRVQRSGGKVMETSAFLRGYAIQEGQRFGEDAEQPNE